MHSVDGLVVCLGDFSGMWVSNLMNFMVFAIGIV